MEEEKNLNAENTVESTLKKESNEKAKKASTFYKILFTVLAVGLFFIAYGISEKIKLYGFKISFIESVGGKTLEEAYYSSIGKIYIYMADFFKVIVAGFSSIILCITYK